MRKLILIFLTLILFSCDNLNLNRDKKTEEKKPNNVYHDIIPETILKDSNTETNDTGIEILDDIEQEADAVKVDESQQTQQDLPVVDEITMNDTVQTKDVMTSDMNTMKQEQDMVSKKQQMNVTALENNSPAPVTVQKVKMSDTSSSMIIIGNDLTGQGLSPRSYIHMSFAVFEKRSQAEFIEFQVYAVPIAKRLRRTGYYLLGYNNFARLIKDQAQFTRYWNGKNSRGQFLPKGKYNVYLWYKVKDKNGHVLYTAGRYWGNSRKFYLNLY